MSSGAQREPAAKGSRARGRKGKAAEGAEVPARWRESGEEQLKKHLGIHSVRSFRHVRAVADPAGSDAARGIDGAGLSATVSFRASLSTPKTTAPKGARRGLKGSALSSKSPTYKRKSEAARWGRKEPVKTDLGPGLRGKGKGKGSTTASGRMKRAAAAEAAARSGRLGRRGEVHEGEQDAVAVRKARDGPKARALRAAQMEQDAVGGAEQSVADAIAAAIEGGGAQAVTISDDSGDHDGDRLGGGTNSPGSSAAGGSEEELEPTADADALPQEGDDDSDRDVADGPGREHVDTVVAEHVVAQGDEENVGLGGDVAGVVLPGSVAETHDPGTRQQSSAEGQEADSGGTGSPGSGTSDPAVAEAKPSSSSSRRLKLPPLRGLLRKASSRRFAAKVAAEPVGEGTPGTDANSKLAGESDDEPAAIKVGKSVAFEGIDGDTTGDVLDSEPHATVAAAGEDAAAEADVDDGADGDAEGDDADGSEVEEATSDSKTEEKDKKAVGKWGAVGSMLRFGSSKHAEAPSGVDISALDADGEPRDAKARPAFRKQPTLKSVRAAFGITLKKEVDDKKRKRRAKRKRQRDRARREREGDDAGATGSVASGGQGDQSYHGDLEDGPAARTGGPYGGDEVQYDEFGMPASAGEGQDRDGSADETKDDVASSAGSTIDSDSSGGLWLDPEKPVLEAVWEDLEPSEFTWEQSLHGGKKIVETKDYIDRNGPVTDPEELESAESFVQHVAKTDQVMGSIYRLDAMSTVQLKARLRADGQQVRGARNVLVRRITMDHINEANKVQHQRRVAMEQREREAIKTGKLYHPLDRRERKLLRLKHHEERGQHPPDLQAPWRRAERRARRKARRRAKLGQSGGSSKSGKAGTVLSCFGLVLSCFSAIFGCLLEFTPPIQHCLHRIKGKFMRCIIVRQPGMEEYDSDSSTEWPTWFDVHPWFCRTIGMFLLTAFWLSCWAATYFFAGFPPTISLIPHRTVATSFNYTRRQSPVPGAHVTMRIPLTVSNPNAVFNWDIYEINAEATFTGAPFLIGQSVNLKAQKGFNTTYFVDVGLFPGLQTSASVLGFLQEGCVNGTKSRLVMTVTAEAVVGGMVAQRDADWNVVFGTMALTDAFPFVRLETRVATIGIGDVVCPPAPLDEWPAGVPL